MTETEIRADERRRVLEKVKVLCHAHMFDVSILTCYPPKSSAAWNILVRLDGLAAEPKEERCRECGMPFINGLCMCIGRKP